MHLPLSMGMKVILMPKFDPTKYDEILLKSDLKINPDTTIIRIDGLKLKTKKYHCKDCGNSFKGLGKKVVCPSCQSDNVELAE